MGKADGLRRVQIGDLLPQNRSCFRSEGISVDYLGSEGVEVVLSVKLSVIVGCRVIEASRLAT